MGLSLPCGWETKEETPLCERLYDQSRTRGQEAHVPSAAVIERRTRAVALARSGTSYDDIAVKLGYASRSGAWKAVQERQVEAVDACRAWHVMGLEGMQSWVWEDVIDGDDKAVGTVLRVIEQRRRLLG